jgi:hypothetical protein
MPFFQRGRLFPRKGEKVRVGCEDIDLNLPPRGDIGLVKFAHRRDVFSVGLGQWHDTFTWDFDEAVWKIRTGHPIDHFRDVQERRRHA